MFNSKGTTLKKNMFTFVVYISPVSERSFRIYIQNKRVSTNFKSNLRKMFLILYFLSKIETIVFDVSVILVFYTLLRNTVGG